MSLHSILYLGSDFGTSGHRANALRRLGHDVTVLDPRQFLPRLRAIDYWLFHTGARLLGPYVRRKVLSAIGAKEFDIALVDGGALVERRLVEDLRQRCGAIANYNIDDPFGSRDGSKWRLYLEAVKAYDLIVVVRDCNVQEALSAGARNIQRVFMSADELAHAPRYLTEEDRSRWHSKVAFVGAWMPERGPFLARLVELKVPLTIYGNRWSRSREWPMLRSCWRGPELRDAESYAKAIQSADVCLGLLSKGNRDMSTTRSFEIPHLAGVLCAERTKEHLSLYDDGSEAVFWSSPEECAERCNQLLADPRLRQRLSEAARARCLRNKTTNEPTLASIVARATALANQRSTSAVA